MAQAFRTHYDNLMVARAAPPEVIAAAYRTLCKHLHPDLNQGDPRAERVMQIVNASYAVLSDPLKRRAHDEWIRARENESSAEAAQTPPTSTVKTSSTGQSLGRHLARYWTIYFLVGIFGIWAFVEEGPPAASGLPSYVASPTVSEAEAQPQPEPPAEPAYVRPETAPNGSTWPMGPGYVSDYPIARADGLSTLTIDNQSNSTDKFVKLVALDADKTVPIRHAFVPAYQSLTMNDIRAGLYDVRYMDLEDGSLSRSESFELQEIVDDTGTQFSVITTTLYKVSNGNMQTYSLAEDEF